MDSLIVEIYQKFNIGGARERRQVLIEKMAQLNSKYLDCVNCTGICCTSVANSMQTDPLQTLELLNFLYEQNLWNDELEQKLSKCVSDYRLDVEISTGPGTSFRRTYTCPFFSGDKLGCQLSQGIKPYGCLGFNPTSTGVSEGENCSSDQELLKSRDDRWSMAEEQANQLIKERYNLYWDKLPMPLALLELNKSWHAD